MTWNRQLLYVSFVCALFLGALWLVGRGSEAQAGQAALQRIDNAAAQVITPTTGITPTVITAVSLPTVNDTPAITHGPISGEVTAERAVLWARGSEAGQINFTVTAVTDPDFEAVVAEAAVAIDETGDFIGEVEITGLDASTAYYYRAVLTVDDETSDFIQGYFVTAPAADETAAFDFVFGACLGGQGYCRDPETGWFIFETMLSQQPDFFLSTGDAIYVDSACNTPNNVAGAEGPYSDLAGFRTRYRYHLEDTPYANFLAQTPVYVTWDDHEIVDNFGGPALSQYNATMFEEGTQAFFEYWPLQQTDGQSRIYRSIQYGAQAEIIILDTRSYRDPNVNWDPHPRDITPKTMLGTEQFAWLQEALAESEATWKLIVSSTPLAYPTGFPQPEVDGRDGWANYTEKSGYETELMSLIFFIESQDIENVVFLTGDTHWPFALSYDPDRDGEANFYEFSSSPLSAITLPPPDTLDPTFNPTVMYAEGEFNGTLFNFGHITIDEAGDLTFRILDREGTERYNVTISPE